MGFLLDFGVNKNTPPYIFNIHFSIPILPEFSP